MALPFAVGFVMERTLPYDEDWTVRMANDVFRYGRVEETRKPALRTSSYDDYVDMVGFGLFADDMAGIAYLDQGHSRVVAQDFLGCVHRFVGSLLRGGYGLHGRWAHHERSARERLGHDVRGYRRSADDEMLVLRKQPP